MQSECCISDIEVPAQPSQNIMNLQKMITDTFNNLIKPDELQIKNLERRVNSLSLGDAG